MAFLLVVFALVAHEPHAGYGTADVCGCAEAIAVDGRCAKCEVGYFALVRIESEPLYKALDSHGHDVAAERTKCERCRKLISAGGYCDACHMGFVDGKAFFGRIGYHMGKGRTVDPADRRTSCCPTNGDWCSACERGWVGNREFTEPANFAAARRYMAILSAALVKAKQCEHCALAVIADTRCHVCKVEYRDGKPAGDGDAPARKQN